MVKNAEETFVSLQTFESKTKRVIRNYSDVDEREVPEITSATVDCAKLSRELPAKIEEIAGDDKVWGNKARIRRDLISQDGKHN